ncbi:hypothetical protein P2H44_03215 [Albimonas sp. CAU 1670]|uniref:hypothetical protein n=1 Tax=Albimonas sp. CAU 1670 TaxID=3032599 RepID=UPI0023DA4F4C|nr:hypothetical protein [Albimonas sp. CAU 1670]MDF2231554.1 hypothetical protein [Albimonas sp. CAU 1670]
MTMGTSGARRLRGGLAGALAAALLAPGAAQAVWIDGFDGTPAQEFSRLIDGDPPGVSVWSDPSALANEREVESYALGGIAINSWTGGALEMATLATTALPPTRAVQNIAALTYDYGDYGAPGPSGGLDVDLTDAGAADRFILFGTLLWGGIVDPVGPAGLLFTAQVHGAGSAFSGGFVQASIGPVLDASTPPQAVRLDLPFADLAAGTGGAPADLGAVGSLRLVMNFSAYGGRLAVTDLCTGNAGGCVFSTPEYAALPEPVPAPAALWLMAGALGALGAALGLRRGRSGRTAP